MRIASLLLLPGFMMLCAFPAHAVTGDAPSSSLKIDEAVNFALGHNPALRTADALEESASAQTELARSSLLPRLDLTAQENRATGNVVPGALFSMPDIPTVSGPVSGKTLDRGLYSSAVGVSGSWDMAGLIRRIAAVDAALAERQRAHAGTDAQRLAVAFKAANTFIDTLSAVETVKAARANADRAQVLASQVKALVTQELRPGAELSRADAEMALALTGVIRAEQAEAIRRAELAQTLGIPGQPIDIDPGELLHPPPATQPAARPLGENPVLVEARQALVAGRLRKRIALLEYIPRVEVVAALWSRGSGSALGGSTPAEAQGRLPNTSNWAAGIVATWPIMDIFSIRARAHQESANVKALASRQDEIAQTVQTQIDSARAILEGARKIAQETPIELEAARAAERQATARYQAGLTSVVEVAESQRLLAQAEIDDAQARLGVWQAMLLLSRATGDLEPFLAAVHYLPEGER